MKNFNARKSPANGNKNINAKSPVKISSKKSLSIQTNSIMLSNIDLMIYGKIKENFKHFFSSLSSIANSEFFIKLSSVRNNINDLIFYLKETRISSEYEDEYFYYLICRNSHSQDFATFKNKLSTESMSSNKEIYVNCMLRSLEGWIEKVNGTVLNAGTMNNLPKNLDSISKDLHHLDQDEPDEELKLNLSDDGIIEYINNKNNSVSFSIPLKRTRAHSSRSECGNQKKLTYRPRMTSEEIEKRMQYKLDTAERNKHRRKLDIEENLNKIMTKISNIKKKRKIQNKENMKRLREKLENYNMRHMKFLEEKTSKARREQEKVAEIKFLNTMEKENRDLSIAKKLNISTERRQNYMKEKFRKYSPFNIDFLDKPTLVEEKLKKANKRKAQYTEEMDLLKNVYSENFIWELVQADCFDLELLNEITNITKFEILKAKLKKDKGFIESLIEKKEKSKFCSNSSNVFSNKNENCLEEAHLIAENNPLTDSENEEEQSYKRSKSFTFFNERDFDQIDYIFHNDGQNKKKKKKKKKKILKDKIIKSIDSMSNCDFNIFFKSINKNRKIKKFLIKSKSGKYIKSKIIIRGESIKPHEETLQEESPIEQFGTDKEEEKLIKSIVKNNSDNLDSFLKSESSNTILINSESLTNILEKNSITVRWCKLCNLILPQEQDASSHVSKLEHKRLKTEYGISLQDDSNLVMVFQTLPGDISEDLKNERLSAIKLRSKKVKQKLLLRAVKHENFWSYKQDFPSNNKQRLQKISFDIEKQTTPNIKDYESLENSLKDLIKILEQKKQNDLHIMRSLKVIHFLVEILKKPAVCLKSEIKNLGKILELVVKILMYFSGLIENRNYMVVTNRVSTIVDLLLWVLNKPSKIPLGISFLPDLIYLITIHIKHRIPFEYLSMKDDFLEYLFVSNILVKFRQKFGSIIGPIDLTSGFGSFPLVLLKSLGMIEALTSQINLNYMSKPVYVKNSKMSENILFILENTELVGIIQLITTMLLSNGPIKIQNEMQKIPVLPQTVVSATIQAVKVLNNIARLDLLLFQV